MEGLEITPWDTCLRCGNPATRFCDSCNDNGEGVRESRRMGYCTSECQSMDRARHMNECERLQCRRAIYRAGEITRDAFFIYRELMFDLYTLGAEHDEKSQTFYILAQSAPRETIFMSKAASMIKDPDYRKAALSYDQSDRAMTLLYRLFFSMVFGLITNESRNLTVHLTKVPWNPVLANPWDEERTPTDLDKESNHSVFYLEPKNDDPYIVDLTGMQFNIKEAVIPWVEYSQKYKPQVKKQRTFGDRGMQPELWKSQSSDPLMQLRFQIYRKCLLAVVKNMNKAVEVLEKSCGKLADVVRMTNNEFMQLRPGIIAALREGAEEGLEALQTGDGPLIAMGNGVSDAEVLAPTLKEVGRGTDEEGYEYVTVEEVKRFPMDPREWEERNIGTE